MSKDTMLSYKSRAHIRQVGAGEELVPILEQPLVLQTFIMSCAIFENYVADITKITDSF